MERGTPAVWKRFDGEGDGQTDICEEKPHAET
jgi:hypothetical protein